MWYMHDYIVKILNGELLKNRLLRVKVILTEFIYIYYNRKYKIVSISKTCFFYAPGINKVLKYDIIWYAIKIENICKEKSF